MGRDHRGHWYSPKTAPMHRCKRSWRENSWLACCPSVTFWYGLAILPAETFFVKRIWNICSYLCVSFGVYLHSICIYVLSHQHIGHSVLKEKAFRVYFKKSINLSCLSLETSANLSRYFSLSRHTGSLQNPPHGVAANVTGRFTARTFHSRKLAGVFGERKRSCVRVNLII